jgi:hypothetical protein
MKRASLDILAVVGLVFSGPVSSAAETTQFSGTVCWTGTIKNIGTTEKDYAWIWTIDWTYTTDDDNPELAQSGGCFGTGAMIDGQPRPNPEFCLHNRTDGAAFMSTGMSSPDGSKFTMFGGTGELAGLSGSFNGGARLDLPADEGKIAGCRKTNGEMTLPS